MIMQIQASILEESVKGYNEIFNMYEMEKAISKLENTSPGTDRIENLFLKQLPFEYKKNLLNLYNISWLMQEVPKEWKNGQLLPILKAKKTQMISNPTDQ